MRIIEYVPAHGSVTGSVPVIRFYISRQAVLKELYGRGEINLMKRGGIPVRQSISCTVFVNQVSVVVFIEGSISTGSGYPRCVVPGAGITVHFL